VDLLYAKITGMLDMSGSSFEGALNANTLSVDGDVFMRDGAKFKDVVMRGAKINGELGMNGSTFDGTPDLSDSEIAQELNLADLEWHCHGNDRRTATLGT
jgi:hypothetical protein